MLESRCNAASGERQATSPKAFPLAADPSGVLAEDCPWARIGVIAVKLDLFTQPLPRCHFFAEMI